MEEQKISDSSANTTPSSEQKESSKKKLTKPTIVSLVILATLLLTGLATAAYTQIVLNDPDRIWQDSVSNTRLGINEVNSVLTDINTSEGSISGSLDVQSPIVINSTISGEWSENEAQVESETNIAGSSLSSDLIVVDNEGDSSDLYLKIDGLDNVSVFSELLIPGSNAFLNRINDKWYKLSSSELEAASGSPELFYTDKILKEDYTQDIDKISGLLDEYVFSEDESNNVIAYEPVGREEFNGNDTYKYKISINDDRSQEFLNEIKQVLEGSSVSQLKNTEELESVYDLDSLMDEIKNEKLELTVWVDMNLRYFRNLRINLSQSTEANQSYIDVGLDYDGGDEMPFYINAVIDSEDNNNSSNLLLNASLNRASLELELGFKISVDMEQPISANSTLRFTPGENSLNVEAPGEYESFDSLVESLSSLNIGNLNTSIDQEESAIILDDVEL